MKSADPYIVAAWFVLAGMLIWMEAYHRNFTDTARVMYGVLICACGLMAGRRTYRQSK